MASHQQSVQSYRCPECHGDLVVHHQSWQCADCGHAPHHGAD